MPEPELTADERRHAAGLMRVNHTQAAREEEEHLAWTQQRLAELNDRPSLVNPLWYAGSFAIGLAAGMTGDGTNLGFVVETERQVEEHLSGHMDRLPPGDVKSRAIVAAMRDDEMRHGAAARDSGADDLPWLARALMRGTARLMTLTAYRL
ncbi:MAG: 2-polyprenyl-3-methyl-6-methoxy-1,4-benzoquinone monooxygenase [Betaproteobacteria bacterium]|nr:MAG: 2-polyprenyl-3-methyl-6-methoxy-1,4-benzoquinone monooxygenase [Betaproteobacteria bacterium]